MMNYSWAFYIDGSNEWRWQLIRPFSATCECAERSFRRLEHCLRDAVAFGYREGAALFIDSRGPSRYTAI